MRDSFKWKPMSVFPDDYKDGRFVYLWQEGEVWVGAYDNSEDWNGHPWGFVDARNSRIRLNPGCWADIIPSVNNTCTGCCHLRTKIWETYIPGSYTERGISAECTAFVKQRKISSYWDESFPSPSWCPFDGENV